MSKLLPTLFLIIILAIIGGVTYLSFTDVPVAQDTVENTVTLEAFQAKKL